MKRILKVYSDGQEEIVRIREWNWPLIFALAMTGSFWAFVVVVFR